MLESSDALGLLVIRAGCGHDYEMFGSKRPRSAAPAKRFRAHERERSDGSWDYGLTFIFPRPPHDCGEKTGTTQR
jgi:hypothetical protein